MTALKADFDEFLHAPIGADASGMPLTMLSALARLDVDPWEEAASLARLPVEPATARLVALLATVPNWRVPEGEVTKIATLLVGLLHRPAPKTHQAADVPLGETVAAHSRDYRVAIYGVVALAFLLALQWATAIQNPPAPMDTRIVPVSTD